MPKDGGKLLKLNEFWRTNTATIIVDNDTQISRVK